MSTAYAISIEMLDSLFDEDVTCQVRHYFLGESPWPCVRPAVARMKMSCSCGMSGHWFICQEGLDNTLIPEANHCGSCGAIGTITFRES